MGQVSHFGFHLAVSMADAIGLDYRRPLAALRDYHGRMESKLDTGTTPAQN